MKIRFYHWWVYRLFSYFWTPICEEEPHLVRHAIAHAEAWLKSRENKAKPDLKVVK